MPTTKESIKFVWEFITSAQHNLVPTPHQDSMHLHRQTLEHHCPPSGSLVLICSWVLLHVQFFFFELNFLSKPMLSYHLPSLCRSLPARFSRFALSAGQYSLAYTSTSSKAFFFSGSAASWALVSRPGFLCSFLYFLSSKFEETILSIFVAFASAF